MVTIVDYRTYEKEDGSQFQALIVTLIVFGIIISYITGSDSSTKEKNKGGVKDFLKDWNSFSK